jgi:hypothetical protein
MAVNLNISVQEIENALSAADTITGVVEKLPFLPTSVQHGLEDLRKVLDFVNQIHGQVGSGGGGQPAAPAGGPVAPQAPQQ